MMTVEFPKKIRAVSGKPAHYFLNRQPLLYSAIIWDTDLDCIHLDGSTIKQFKVLHHINIGMNLSVLHI